MENLHTLWIHYGNNELLDYHWDYITFGLQQNFSTENDLKRDESPNFPGYPLFFFSLNFLPLDRKS